MCKVIKTQVSLEVTLSLVVIFMLFAASARAFVWFSNSLVGRHKAFEDTRIIDNSFDRVSCVTLSPTWEGWWACSGGDLGETRVSVREVDIECGEGCRESEYLLDNGILWKGYKDATVVPREEKAASPLQIKSLTYTPPSLNLVKDD